MTHVVDRGDHGRVESSPDGSPASASPPPRHPGLVVIMLCLAQFMVILDLTVVNVALPEIGRSLGLGREVLTWVVTAYTLTFGGLLILGGRLADAFGRKLIFHSGLMLFTFASLTTGLASSAGMLLASRIAQGVGAALLSPAALSILTTEFTGRARDRALGVWAAIGGGGAAVGVLVGGALTSGPGWAWAFLVNVPVGLLVAALAHRFVPARARGAASSVDLPGAVIGTASVALLLYGVIRAGEHGWFSSSALVPIGAAVVAAVVFVLVERRAPAPLIPSRLLRRPPLPGGFSLMLGASAVMMPLFFLGSFYLQQVRGLSAVRTGLAFLPVAVLTIAGAHVAAHLVGRLGTRVAGAAGLLTAAAGLALLSWRGTAGGVALAFLPGLALAGAGIGAAFVAATTGALAGMDHAHAGLASGILNTGHELGGSLGIAAFSTVAASSLTGSTAAGTGGFTIAYLAMSMLAVVLAVGAAGFLLPRGLPPATDGPRFVH